MRKYYLFDETQRIGGGVYLWKSKADAEAVYTPEWKAYIAERYGTPPDIRYFETSVVVDNESEKTILDAARRSLQARRLSLERAEIVHHAAWAVGSARLAGVAAVQDQPVVRVQAIFLGHAL